MQAARWILATLLLLIPLAVTFAWIDSFARVTNFPLNDNTILYSTQGTLWYTRNTAGGLNKTDPVDHGQRISDLLRDEPSAWNFKYAARPPLSVFIVPYWPLLLLSLVPLVLFPWRKLLKPVRYGRCPNCNYDLRASPHRCPECGTPIARGGTAG